MYNGASGSTVQPNRMRGVQPIQLKVKWTQWAQQVVDMVLSDTAKKCEHTKQTDLKISTALNGSMIRQCRDKEYGHSFGCLSVCEGVHVCMYSYHMIGHMNEFMHLMIRR